VNLAARPRLPRATVAVNEVVHVAAFGYAPGSDVALAVSSRSLPLGTTVANRVGHIGVNVTIPARLASGRHKITGSGFTATGAPLTKSVAVRVARRTGLAITRRRLPPGTTGMRYHAALTATGGSRPYRWKVVRGVLPKGLRLTPTSGTIVGKPRAAGTFIFAVEVIDANSPVPDVGGPTPLAIKVRAAPS
jgi:large repetitive protein